MVITASNLHTCVQYTIYSMYHFIFTYIDIDAVAAVVMHIYHLTKLNLIN